MNQPAFLAAAALLAAGTYGWGRAAIAILDRLDRRREVSLVTELGGPLIVAVGVAVVLVLGGFAVAADLARASVIVAILSVGASVTAFVLVQRARHGFRAPRRGGWFVTASFLVVTLLAYGATLTGPINPNDDDPGYIYLAYRLLGTGGLVDPFNLRRITSYGGGELFEALFVRAGGPNAALGMEWFFSLLLVAALVVRHSSRRFAAVGLLVIGLALTVIHPVGAWANSAPTFSGVALSLALFQLLSIWYRDRSWPIEALIGLLVGGTLALRYEFAIPAIIATVFVAIAAMGRSAWRPLAVAGTSGAVAVAGWAVALQRSSGTSLFPIIPGNYNESFPWEDPSVRSFRQSLSRFWGELATNGLGAQLLALAAACILLVTLRQIASRTDSIAPPVVVTVGGALGCLVLVVAETRQLSGGVLLDIGRYNAPSALAVALFVLDDLWNRAGLAGLGRSAEEGPERRWKRRLSFALCATMATTVFAIPVGAALSTVGPYGSISNTLRTATYQEGLEAVRRLDGAYGNSDALAATEPTYAAINAVIPAGATVLAAVDEPRLLSFSRYRFATLDIAGAVSPPPHLPLTAGGPAVLAYLRRLGYNGIVASTTNAPGLYNYRAWKANLASGIENYHAMAVNFVAWAHVLTALA